MSASHVELVLDAERADGRPLGAAVAVVRLKSDPDLLAALHRPGDRSRLPNPLELGNAGTRLVYVEPGDYVVEVHAPGCEPARSEVSLR